MGPKRDKAGGFTIAPAAFDVSREDAIAWLNGVLDAGYEDDAVEKMAADGWAWPQLLHYCTLPEDGIVDLKEVWFGAGRGSAARNYEVLQAALKELGVECEFVTEATIPRLLDGGYSEGIDLLHWMKFFVSYMGSPMFYHAKDERDAAAPPSQPAPPAKAAAAKHAAKPGAKRAVGVKDRSAGAPTSERPAKAPARGTAAARKPAAKASAPARAAPPAHAAELATLKNELAAAQAAAELQQQVATAMAMKFDGAIAAVNKYLAGRDDVAEDVRREAAAIMAESLQ
eukprot:TRINITY_DN27441_c0_g1_i1.p1 TRINITY_DN27441_c0_g1~~TRINITY_DN27441_c0_g1_i1.p1  ORF type:complete len:285 (+),score=130.38 TRINITY_DN27441_c0_g1_i1:52-906(+)